MKCHNCKEEKLSKEFPLEHLTKECIKHPLLHCLRCVTKSVREEQKCSVSECGVRVTEDNTQYKQYVETLEFLFPTVADGEDANQAESLSPASNNSESEIIVTTLTGECISIEYNSSQTIKNLKDMVFKLLETSSVDKCLLYNGTELKEREDHDQQLKRLEDYDVQPNSIIYLLIVLCEVPEDFDDVKFNLSWGYPNSGIDFLDASVFLYKGSKFFEIVDFKNKNSKAGKASAVKHSGDVRNDDERKCHQTIDVSIKSLPSSVDRLAFTLSAFKSPNISKFRNLSLQFYDARCPKNQLCDDEVDEVASSQAVVMCFLTKTNKKWRVVSVKHPSRGNVLKYGPLKDTIESIIQREKGTERPKRSLFSKWFK